MAMREARETLAALVFTCRFVLFVAARSAKLGIRRLWQAMAGPGSLVGAAVLRQAATTHSQRPF